MNNINELVEALKEAENKGPKPFDTLAEVMRIEDDIAWVQMPGSDDETPVRMTIAAKEGDTVQVRVSGGTAFLVGNASAPPTDNKEAFVAQEKAQDAKETALEATGIAEQAVIDAETAHTAAIEAQEYANTANTAANSALTQLSVVEDVVGTLNWISEHGTYSVTSDTTVVPGKLYFTRTGSGTSSDPYVYNIVTNPTGNPSTDGYYELTSIDEAVSNYVASHLALTSAGLWVVKDNNGYKILLANNGMYVYNSSGTQVAYYGSTSAIGNPNGIHVEVKTDGFYLYNGSTELAHLKSDEIDLVSGKLKFAVDYDGDNRPFVSFFADSSISNFYFNKNVTFYNSVDAIGESQFADLMADKFELTSDLGGEIEDWSDFFRSYGASNPYVDDDDANNIPVNCIIYISSNDLAYLWNHIPVNNPGYLFTFISNRKAQIYWERNTDNIYVRNSQTGTWSDWKQITVQKKTTTLTAVTPSGAAIPSGSYGGFYTEGKHCYVYVRCKLNSAWSSGGGNVTLFTGLPVPAFVQPVLPVMVANAANGVAWVNDSGILVIKPETAISTSNFIVINGHYVIS